MVVRVLFAVLLAMGCGWIGWCWSQYAITRYKAGGRLGYKDVPQLMRSLVDTKPKGASLLLLACFIVLGAAGARFLPRSHLIDVLVVTTLLFVLAYVDIRVHRLPNMLLVGLAVWALVRSLWLGYPDLVSLGLGALEGGLLFLLIALVGRGAMGMGDVKLAAVIGALLGHPFVWAGLLLGILLGGLSALFLLALRRIGRGDYMAYGPYLALGAWLVFLRLWVPF